MFTWSLAWASSPARLAITSLAFMLVDVLRARLKDVDRELIVVIAGSHLVARAGDALRDLHVEQVRARRSRERPRP